MNKQVAMPDLSGLMGALASAAAKAGNGATNFDKPSWWTAYAYPDAPYITVDNLINFAKSALFFNAMQHSQKVYDYEDELEFTGKIDELVSALQAEGVKLVYDARGGQTRKSNGLFLVNDICGIFLDIKNTKTTKLYIESVTSSSDLSNKIQQIVKLHTVEGKDNMLHMLSSDSHSTALMEIGKLAAPLERSNYTEPVIKSYNYVVKQFNSSKPAGRLLILNGLPGTGKTYIVRGLLNDLVGGTFLLLPPDMISDISKPQLIETISDAAKNKFSSGPLYLIIEDADEALLRRGSDNINLISSLLNLGDGLLGSAFDLRIIATTNAAKLEIEPAIMRPGRLCSAINLDKLPADKASELFIKLAPEKWKKWCNVNHLIINIPQWFTQPTTLADVYQAAISE